MAISKYQGITWSSPGAFYLSKIWSLYCRELDWDFQLCNLGYHGLPDPIFGDGNPNPDLLAFHPQDGDLQHIHIRPCEAIDNSSDPDSDIEHLESCFENSHESSAVSAQEVRDYLSGRGYDFIPDIQEIVIVLPNSVYDKHGSFIDREINERDFILWLVESNGNVAIWKEKGSHSNLNLDREISTEMKAYPSSNDLLQYTRSTDRDRLKFEFISRLVRNAGRNNKLRFEFEEVDEIMVSTHPPILGHIPKETRVEEYWGDFLYSMLNTFGLIEQTENPNEYEWTKEKFANEPRYPHRILENIRDDLEIEGA